MTKKKYTRTPNCKCSMCDKEIYRRPCQIEKYNAVFCSQDCYGKSQQKLNKCTMCDNMILASKNAKTCSKACANKQKIGMRYSPEWTRPKKDKVKALLQLRERLSLERGYKCAECNYNKLPILNIHHIVERSQGGSDELSNLEFLCPTCHAEEHYIRREEIKEEKRKIREEKKRLKEISNNPEIA